MAVEKLSDVYERGKKVGESYVGRTRGPEGDRGETVVDFKRSGFLIFNRENRWPDDDGTRVWVKAGAAPKLEAALKLWKRRSCNFAAYRRHYCWKGMLGYYYNPPCKKKEIKIGLEGGKKEIEIRLEGGLGGEELDVRKIPRPTVEKIGGVEIRRICDLTARREKIGEIYKLDSRLFVEFKRYDLGVGHDSRDFGDIVSSAYSHIDYGSAGIGIRRWEVDDFLEIIQLWKNRGKS